MEQVKKLSGLAHIMDPKRLCSTGPGACNRSQASPDPIVGVRCVRQVMNETLARSTDQNGVARGNEAVGRSQQLETLSRRFGKTDARINPCLLYTSPSPRDIS